MKNQIKKSLLVGMLCLSFGYLRAQVIVSSALAISGPNPLCDSATYNIPGLPSGISVSWSVTGNLSISGSSTSTSVKIVKTAVGSGTITATISNGCGSGALPTVTITTIEPPYITEIRFTNGVQEDGNWCSSDNANGFEVFSTGGVGTVYYEVKIYKYPSLTLFYSGTVSSAQGITAVPAGTYSVEARIVSNVCGNSGWFGTDVESYDCQTPGYRMASVYPNPGNTEVNVSYNRPAEKLSKDKKASVKGSYQVKLLNNKGQVLRELVNDAAKTNSKIDVSNLQSGTYILHIIDNGSVIRKQVIIKH